MNDAEITLKHLDPWRKERLGLCALMLTRRVLAQPGGRKMIEEEMERMRQEAQQKKGA
jgi:hypothetical protein